MSKRKRRPPRDRRVRRSKSHDAVSQTQPGGAGEASALETDDPYLAVIDEQWDNILMMYNLFADKRPVMQYEVRGQKIYAYPYREFKADLNQRSQELLGREQ